MSWLSSSPWPGRLTIVLLAVLVALGIAIAPPAIAVFGEMLRDPLVRLMARHDAESRITVVDIDESSLATLGPWPWPRDRLADLVEILLGPMGARAVALDMVLPEAEQSTGDARLVALATYAPLTLAIVLDYVPRRPPLALGVPGKGRIKHDGDQTVTATGFIANHASLANARCIGNIGFMPDADGAIRRLPGASVLQGQVFPSLAEALADCAGEGSRKVRDEIDDAGLWRVPFRQALSAFTVVSAGMVLAHNAPAELFAGRYVLIGSSALGLSDRVTTPLSVSTSGVMVHAASLSALLDRHIAPSVQNGKTITAGWLGVSLALWLFFLPRMSPISGVILLLGSGMAWLGLVAWMIDIHVPVLPVLAAYSILLLAGIPFEWWWSRHESARVIRIFSHYVAPSVLNELLHRRDERPLLPNFREVSVLVADMEGYTQATALLGLEEAANLTRDFLDCLTRPVLAEEGTLDKYTGDGLVAFWNAPLPCHDHAERAVRTAMRMVTEVQMLNSRRMALGFAPVRVRVGIETGLALVGDLGTRFRSTYTAVGNCINLASKMESAARALGVSIVIGPSTFAHLAHPESFRSLGPLLLGGMSLECWSPKE